MTCDRGALAPALVLVFAVAVPASAQALLTLDEAMTRARTATAEARALTAAGREAEARVSEARAGFLPRVEVTTGVQRGDHPVFVFSSLLAQRRFAAANFDITALNRPDPISNVRTAIAVEQPIFDAGRTYLGVQAAGIEGELVRSAGEAATQDLALAAARAYARVLQLESAERAARTAQDVAASDVDRARARSREGLVTEADVRAADVRLADAREQVITSAANLAIARMQLSAAIGAPLDERFTLVRPASSEPPDAPTAIAAALRARPEIHAAEWRGAAADLARRRAQAAWYPTVSAAGGWEFNGRRWSGAQASWVVGVQAQVTVFNGFADRARLTAAGQSQRRAAADTERTRRDIELDVRTALARLDAARARETSGRAAVDQARESQRIIRDRYEQGLATITDVLRAADATTAAEAREVAAAADVMLGRIALDRATGSLGGTP